MRGEIEFQRRHRDKIALHRVDVGAFAQLGRVTAEAQPVIWQAAPVGTLLDAEIVGELALAVTRMPSTSAGGQLGKFRLRNVPTGRSTASSFFKQRRRQRLCRLVGDDALAVLDVVGLAERDRLDAEQRAFHGAGDGARNR